MPNSHQTRFVVSFFVDDVLWDVLSISRDLAFFDAGKIIVIFLK
jgi:hypothetical protein